MHPSFPYLLFSPFSVLPVCPFSSSPAFSSFFLSSSYFHPFLFLHQPPFLSPSLTVFTSFFASCLTFPCPASSFPSSLPHLSLLYFLLLYFSSFLPNPQPLFFTSFVLSSFNNSFLPASFLLSFLHFDPFCCLLSFHLSVLFFFACLLPSLSCSSLLLFLSPPPPSHSDKRLTEMDKGRRGGFWRQISFSCRSEESQTDVGRMTQALSPDCQAPVVSRGGFRHDEG